VVERAALSPTAMGKGEKIGSEGKIASEHIEAISAIIVNALL
jgi:hypothetical protein